MEVETTAQPATGSGSSSAAYPRWVTLERYCKSNVDDDSPCPRAVAKTLAAARTSNGHPIQVSLTLAEPPATSSVRVKLLDGVHLKYWTTIAAHGDSLLVMVNFDQECDYFVYSVGDAAADPPRPPSLLLLPPCCLSESEDEDDGYSRGYPAANLVLRTDWTGILRRRGEDEVVVAEAQLKMFEMSEDGGQKPMPPELFLFRSGVWSVKRPRICCGNDGDEHGELPSDWTTSSVFPVGDRILCWANEDSDDGGGVLICDVLEERPCLQYVRLPSVPTSCYGRNVCATAGGGTLKFVNIFPRCCCGGAGASDCKRSHHAYTINTWTLRMDDGMDWVMDGMVDATDLWSLDTYKGLPRVPLGFPVVSMYEPHVICFALCESSHIKYGGDRTLWLLKVDTRSKTIQSISRHPDWIPEHVLISSNVSSYLNPYATCSSGDGTSKCQSRTGQMDIEKKKSEENDTNLMLQSPCKSSVEPARQPYDEILAAFREIPSYGLACDDMLKAYAILSSDNGCRIRSLLRLPMKLRKDWLLMEIKADDDA